MPYWRLSGFYLFYFATLGALVPYWSLYLKGLGFSAVEIGELVAILMATKIVAPNIWGWITPVGACALSGRPACSPPSVSPGCSWPAATGGWRW